jgi:hypothetical protein
MLALEGDGGDVARAGGSDCGWDASVCWERARCVGIRNG